MVKDVEEKEIVTDHTYFVKKARELGASDAKIILPEQVFTAEWVRLSRKFGRRYVYSPLTYYNYT